MKKEFKLNQKVRIVNVGGDVSIDGKTGYVLGKSFENVIDFYIVMLDEPRPDALAISITEACLEAIDE